MSGPVSASWRDEIQSLQTEAGGLMALLVIQLTDLPDLILAGLAGDAEAIPIVRMVTRTIDNIRTAPRKRPMLCGSCPRRLRGDEFAIVIARPACDGPSHGLALAICERCATTPEAIEAKAVVALRRIWPDGRTVRVTHPNGGQA